MGEIGEPERPLVVPAPERNPRREEVPEPAEPVEAPPERAPEPVPQPA